MTSRDEIDNALVALRRAYDADAGGGPWSPQFCRAYDAIERLLNRSALSRPAPATEAKCGSEGKGVPTSLASALDDYQGACWLTGRLRTGAAKDSECAARATLDAAILRALRPTPPPAETVGWRTLFHRAWTADVGTPGYDKRAWANVEAKILAAERAERETGGG